MSVDITVVIPTYNGAERLPAMLDRLRSQTGTEHFSWDVMVVDNNSRDNTAEVVQRYQNDWNCPWPLRYCLETTQGAAFARRRGVQEATSAWVGLLDDDNLPAPDWVAAAYAFGQSHAQAGAFSGQIHGDYEVDPPAEFSRIALFLAVTSRGTKPKLYEPARLNLPPGAGLVVRRQAWLDSLPDRPLLAGRVGQSMVGGEDLEPLIHMHQAGWEIWYNPEMHTYHQIPGWRLEREYLLTLAHGAGLNTCHLSMIGLAPWKAPMVLARVFSGSLRRVLVYGLRAWRSKDLISDCELAFFMGKMLSPFYFLKDR